VGPLDSTRIVVRRGTEEVGRRVRRALGLGRVVVQLDTTRLLDASVLLAPTLRRASSSTVAAAAALDVEPAAATQHRLHPMRLSRRSNAIIRAGAGREVRRATGVKRQQVHQRAQRSR